MCSPTPAASSWTRFRDHDRNVPFANKRKQTFGRPPRVNFFQKIKMPNWYWEKKELRATPSQEKGMDFDTETRYRREGVR